MAALLHEPVVRRTDREQPEVSPRPLGDEIPDEAAVEEFGTAALCGW